MIKLKSPAFALIGTAALFLGIVVSAVLGFWNTESTKEPAKIREGEFAGMPSPSDIRGSYTWKDVENAFGLPAALLMEAFSSPSADLKVNSLEAAWAGKLPAGTEIGTDSVRLFVSLYTGLPHEAEAGTLLPESAIAVLEKSGKAEAGLLAPHKARAVARSSPASAIPADEPVATAVPMVGPDEPAKAAAPTAKPVDHAAETGTVGGETTFGQLRSWGASDRDIKEILGGKIGADDELIKDFCAANGIKFGEVKAKLQALAD